MPQQALQAIVAIYTLSGTLVYSRDVAASSGIAEIRGLDQLPAGAYSCIVTTGNQTHATRIMKY